MPSVTIVIPIQNREKFLPRLFRSLAAVDYEDLELVLVDNGSTDSSLSLCRSFAEDAPMVVTVLQERRRGASCARNMGLRHCSTEWIYFFDSDDELSPSFLEEIMPRVGDAQMVAFPIMQDVDGRVTKRAFISVNNPSAQILSSTLCSASMLFRSDFLREIGGWNEGLTTWDDWELGIRALNHQPRILWFPQPYHLAYVHDDSQTGPSMTSRRNAIIKAMETVRDNDVLTPQVHRALYWRQAVVSGLLQREGAEPIDVVRSASRLERLVGRLLQSYTALGGRGAWRIALFL